MQGLVGKTSCLHSPKLTRMKNEYSYKKIIKKESLSLKYSCGLGSGYDRIRLCFAGRFRIRFFLTVGSGSTQSGYISIILTLISRGKKLGRNWIELFDFFEGLDPDYIGLWSDPVPGFS